MFLRTTLPLKLSFAIASARLRELTDDELMAAIATLPPILDEELGLPAGGDLAPPRRDEVSLGTPIEADGLVSRHLAIQLEGGAADAFQGSLDLVPVGRNLCQLSITGDFGSAGLAEASPAARRAIYHAAEVATHNLLERIAAGRFAPVGAR